MPRRSLLSSEQCTRLLAVPVDHAEMAKHYVLSADHFDVRPDNSDQISPGTMILA